MFKKIDLEKPRVKDWGFALFIILLPLYLNDIYNLFSMRNPGSSVYFVSYVCITLSLVLSAMFFGVHAFRFNSSLNPLEKKDFLMDYFLVPVVLYFSHWFLIKLFRGAIGYFKLMKGFGFNYPEFSSPLHESFFMTVGFFLIAVAEQLLFRRYLYSFIGYVTKQNWLAIFLQAFLYGLSHFSSGFASMLASFFFGLFCGIFYHYKKDLWPLIFAQFVINLIYSF
jgi:membrane protease YdiL (CAAX protease family)